MHTRFTIPERLKDLRVAEKIPPPMLVEDKTFFTENVVNLFP